MPQNLRENRGPSKPKPDVKYDRDFAKRAQEATRRAVEKAGKR
jgi:hypothetical protein